MRRAFCKPFSTACNAGKDSPASPAPIPANRPPFKRRALVAPPVSGQAVRRSTVRADSGQCQRASRPPPSNTPRPGCAAPVYPASRGDRVPPVSDSGGQAVANIGTPRNRSTVRADSGEHRTRASRPAKTLTENPNRAAGFRRPFDRPATASEKGRFCALVFYGKTGNADFTRAQPSRRGVPWYFHAEKHARAAGFATIGSGNRSTVANIERAATIGKPSASLSGDRAPLPACQRFDRSTVRRLSAGKDSPPPSASRAGFRQAVATVCRVPLPIRRHRPPVYPASRPPFDRGEHRTRRAGSVRAGFRPMSADLVRRVRNRWPSALLSPQRFDSRPPISRRKRPCKPSAPPVYPASRHAGSERRHHRKRATVRPCRKCAAGFRQAVRACQQSGGHRNAATIGSGQPFDRGEHRTRRATVRAANALASRGDRAPPVSPPPSTAPPEASGLSAIPANVSERRAAC